MSSQSLKTRVLLEKAIMAQEMPQFKLHCNNGEWYFKGWQIATTESRRYQLELAIPPNYPDQMPFLYVTSPVTLLKHLNQGTINEEECSHAFHTGKRGPEGCVQICHFKSNTWDASRTCVGVFTKGILWLISYECHLTNGESIDANLREFKRRQK